MILLESLDLHPGSNANSIHTGIIDLYTNLAPANNSTKNKLCYCPVKKRGEISQLPILDLSKFCNVIYKPSIEILLVKLTTEASQTFSLKNNFQVTGMCLNKRKFFGPTEYLHNTLEPQINEARKKS